MANRPLRAGMLALLGSALSIGLAALVSSSATPAAAQAALPASSLMAPPACTCSDGTNAAGGQVHNCMCGALQCVVAGKVGAAPALFCIK